MSPRYVAELVRFRMMFLNYVFVYAAEFSMVFSGGNVADLMRLGWPAFGWARCGSLNGTQQASCGGLDLANFL